MTTPVSNTEETDPTSLASANYTSTNILSTTFNLLSDMLNSVQNVAAVQAEGLQFYTNWQTWYTTRMAEVPTLGTTGVLGGNQTEAGDANQENTTLIQTMQNRQSVVSDATKQIQTVVNQSEQAATSQADLGTTMLQELGTLLPVVMGQS